MAAPASLIRGIVQRLIPSRFQDDRSADRDVRLWDRGELATTNLWGPTRHAFAEEGSYLQATNPTPGTPFAYSVTAAFADTTPFLYIANPDTSKSLELDFVKILVTTVPASTTQAHYAFVLDSAQRNFTTDNTATLTPVSPNGAVTVATTPIVKVQNNAAASVIAASSPQKRIVGRGTLGGLPVVGDNLRVQFGSLDGGAATTPTTAGSRVDCDVPIIVPPSWSLVMHLWFVSNAATGLSYELNLGMVAR